MNDLPGSGGIILADIIKGSCCLENEILHNYRYNDFMQEGLKLDSVVYCGVDHLTAAPYVKNNGVTVVIEFELIVMYECCNMNTREKRHNLFTDRVKKVLNLDKNMFSVFDAERSSTVCHIRVKNLVCSSEPDLDGLGLSVKTAATVECFLLEEQAVRLGTKSMSSYEGNSFAENHDGMEDHTLDQFVNPLNTDINQMTTFFSHFLGKVAEMIQTNSKMESGLKSKEEEIAVLRNHRDAENRELCKMYSEVNEKNRTIKQVTIQNDKLQKKVTFLEMENSSRDEQIKALKEENIQLKEMLEKEQLKRKANFIQKLKSIIY